MGPRWGLQLQCQKTLKYLNKAVTIVQQSGRYSVDNCTAINFLAFNLRGYASLEISYIINTVITAEMTLKFNLSESYIYSQNSPAIRKVAI